MGPLPEDQLETAVERALESGRDVSPPYRIYTLFDDYPPAPALYVEFEVADDETTIPLIVHNIRYYELGMAQWNVGVVELIVLNELHELTHWAMTDDERTALDERSRRQGRADGYWLNPALLEIIDWLPADYRTVLEREPSLSVWRRIRLSVRRWWQRVRGRLWGR
ncbi:hypothetical protein OB955_11300 [Halobacteria archaeon AArc-m2/3/4]|uniref:Uncharacterized protein n=1 Tax=Natronoglomus mannanivorans TaxID=2979990 RepID=A0AAP2YXP7_9EURY|nr:hypothetical protein [Halobacteria archaeon AArc-xg1-1]MCU4973327.1 hypothetical protein [Halobacteria archaeon AArc-m2/3/4]